MSEVTYKDGEYVRMPDGLLAIIRNPNNALPVIYFEEKIKKHYKGKLPTRPHPDLIPKGKLFFTKENLSLN